ncbi:MAG: hypothetical protein A2Y15_08795 [Clostridiales bacterium GWF2_36_10]|nr:MAG: hypothetical protein A2Y15_08795 [Clostridiales bacterium GWF2_36_10]HAN20441.1 hypothetical protein [Clostridiales bacterium]
MSKSRKILCMLLVIVIFSSMLVINAFAYENQTITVDTPYTSIQCYLVYCNEVGETFIFSTDGGQPVDPIDPAITITDSPYSLDASNVLYDYWGNGDWYMSGTMTLYNSDSGQELNFTVLWTTASGGKVAYIS